MSGVKLAQIFAVLTLMFWCQNCLAAETFRDCADCPEMVIVPAGGFTIGSTAFNSESPPTLVTIPREFAIGKFEVTFDEWAACAKDGGCQSNAIPSDHGWGRGKRPVIYVTWNHTREFIDWLNSKVDGRPYRLLTEAEWEYAARADREGNIRTNYSWGESIACGNANYGGRRGSVCFDREVGEFAETSEVGSYSANLFGLHDMHGNVWEWVEDCWHYGYKGLPDDTKQRGAAWTEDGCVFRVIRGGSWLNEPERLRSSNRSRLGGANRDFNFGFRVGRSLP